MTTSNILHDKVIACIDELISKADKIWSNSSLSTLSIDVSYRTDMGNTAGYAHSGKDKNQVEFNAYLILTNLEDFLSDTIPHEVAHIITDRLYPNAKQSHGPEWKSVMQKLGFNPVRRHSYDTSVIPGNKNKFRYVCTGCETPIQFLLSKLIHKRILEGNNRKCCRCNTRIFYNPL